LKTLIIRITEVDTPIRAALMLMIRTEVHEIVTSRPQHARHETGAGVVVRGEIDW
jgi:hypothetical protein